MIILAVSTNRGRSRGGNLVVQNEISFEMKYIRTQDEEREKMRHLVLQFRFALLFHGQKRQSANRCMYKSPFQINSKCTLGQHARKIQGLQENCKHVPCLPALSVISLTFLICEEIEAR